MSTNKHSAVRFGSLLIAFALLASTSIIFVACDEDSSAIKEPTPDAGPITPNADTGTPINPTADGGQDGGDSGPTDCVQNPTTHLEIINACTNATRVTKNPTLTKLLPDGGLPPLL